MGIYDSSVASKSREIELKEIGLEGEKDLASGFGERFSFANKITYQRYTPMGRSSVLEDEYSKRDDILKQSGLIDGQLLTTQRLVDRANSGNYPGLKSDLLGRNLFGISSNEEETALSEKPFINKNRENDELLLQLQKDNPNLEIKTDEEISSDVAMQQIELLNRDEDLADRSTFLGSVGYLTGSMVGWIRDPTHFLSSLVGLSPAGRLSAASNFFRVGAAESAIVGAIEIAEKPTEVEFRRRFGEPDLTTSEALIESGITVAGAGIIGGGIGALIGKFSRPLARSETNNNAATEASQEIVDEFRRLQGTGTVFEPEVEQAANILDQTLEISRNSPTNTSYETHMSNYAEARRNLAEGQEVQVGVDDIGQVQRASDQDVIAPVGSESAIPESSLDIQNRAVQGLRTALEADDVFITQTGVQGRVEQVSAREVLQQLDNEDAAVRATIDCLG